MKSDKSENNQTKPETRGRKKLENPSVQVSWRIPFDVYQLLEKEQERVKKLTGLDVALSKVLQGVVVKSFGTD